MAIRASNGVTIVIPGVPVPASRPRVTSHGTYHSPKYTEWLRGARTWCWAAFRGKERIMGPVAVTVRFYGARANADIDNLCKGALDALSGIVIGDDRQVMNLLAYRLSGDKRTEIEVIWGIE